MTVNQDVVELYLDILKKTLSYSLWDEPGVPVETFNYARTGLKRTFVDIISKLLRKFELQLVQKRNILQEDHEEGRVCPMLAETMIGLRRLDNIQFCVTQVLKNEVDGDLIETGVWRGGATIFMRGILAAYRVTDRQVFVADSFAGLPKPDSTKYPADEEDRHHANRFLAVSRSEVEHNFRKYGLLDDQVVFLEGWFKDTLPVAPIASLAVMRLDGDMYQSTVEALDHLYPKLSVGGYCIIDDYDLSGARAAVNDFRAKHQIASSLQQIDASSTYWQKLS
jgi:O-methyltransferase